MTKTQPKYINLLRGRVEELRREIEVLQTTIDFYEKNSKQFEGKKSGDTTMNKVLSIAEDLIKEKKGPVHITDVIRKVMENGIFVGRDLQGVRRNVSAILSNDQKKDVRLVKLGNGNYDINDTGF